METNWILSLIKELAELLGISRQRVYSIKWNKMTLKITNLVIAAWCGMLKNKQLFI